MNSLRRVALYFDHALSRTPDTNHLKPMTKLREAANNFVHICNHNKHRLLLKALLPAFVRLNDLGIDVELSYRRGVSEVTGKQPDIVTSSNSLYYCLLYEWGGDTLAVNGRYQVPPGGNARRFFRIFRVAAHNSAGNSFDLLFLGRQVVKKTADVLHVR